MSAEIFARRWIGLFALLAALIAASPLLVSALIAHSACFGTENACRDMAEVYTAHGRMIILIITLVPLAVTLAARTLTANVFVWAFPFGLLMLAGALPLFAAIGGPEVAGWQDAVAAPAFAPLLFLLVLLLALSVGSEDEGRRIWRVLMGIVAAATLFVTAPLWLPGLALLPFAAELGAAAARWIASAQSGLGIAAHLPQLANLCLIAFVLAGAGMMVSARARRAGYA